MLLMVNIPVDLGGCYSRTSKLSSTTTCLQQTGVWAALWCISGGWYHMGMDEVMIGAIIQAVCACAGSENHAKQLRLQRVCLGKLLRMTHAVFLPIKDGLNVPG